MRRLRSCLVKSACEFREREYQISWKKERGKVIGLIRVIRVIRVVSIVSVIGAIRVLRLVEDEFYLLLHWWHDEEDATSALTDLLLLCRGMKPYSSDSLTSPD
jgi:hypothetical protein